jgi:hypothetical protein
VPNADPFTAADAARMSALFARRDDIGLSPVEHDELLRLVEQWTHAMYLEALTQMPSDWRLPTLTQAMVRAALREAAE